MIAVDVHLDGYAPEIDAEQSLEDSEILPKGFPEAPNGPQRRPGGFKNPCKNKKLGNNLFWVDLSCRRQYARSGPRKGRVQAKLFASSGVPAVICRCFAKSGTNKNIILRRGCTKKHDF